jgi:stage II sporulation protein D
MTRNSKFFYDLGLPENTQAYRGLAGEYVQSDQAIQETQGVILEFDGKIFPSFFHTRCGGYTEEARELWPKLDVMPRITRCPPCLKDQQISWKFWMSNSDLRNRLLREGYKIPQSFSVTLHRNSKTQRMKYFQIHDQYIPAYKLRNILGVSNIKSTFFWVSFGKNSMRFYGRGYGHGVGLCQYGATELAKKGISYKKILKHYYPKSSCVENR